MGRHGWRMSACHVDGSMTCCAAMMMLHHVMSCVCADARIWSDSSLPLTAAMPPHRARVRCHDRRLRMCRVCRTQAQRIHQRHTDTNTEQATKQRNTTRTGTATTKTEAGAGVAASNSAHLQHNRNRNRNRSRSRSPLRSLICSVLACSFRSCGTSYPRWMSARKQWLAPPPSTCRHSSHSHSHSRVKPHVVT